MPRGIQPSVKIQTPPSGFLGLDTASEPTTLDLARSRRLYNAYQSKIRALGKRPGSAPVTTSALGAAIRHLTRYPFEQEVAVGAAPSLAAVGDAASTLAAGTYYVRYTHVTDNGETEASAEANVILPPALDDPDTAPTLGQSADGGETLPDGDYFVAYTWKNAVGETMVSPEETITITAGNRLDITIPALPAGATSASIYVGTVTGTLYYQANIAITTHSINAPIDTVTPPPVANTCIVSKLRVTVPAVPYHANSTNIYISTATNTEKLEGNTTTTTFDRSTPLAGTGASYPTTNTTSFRNEILAASGTALYSFYNESLHSATMTDTLVTSDIYDIDFTNSGLDERKLIADTGDLKEYNGSVVVDVTPAADDPLPAPANALVDINAKGNKFIWEHTGHVFVSPGTNEVFYSKRYEYDYFPETQFFLLVRNGDYVNGCGVSFDSVCFIPMRRGWDVLEGVNFDDFDSSNYLNTINGVISPRSIQKITYSTGTQTVAYLSDDGVHEIFTSTIDTQGRQYATRNLMTNKIDFEAFGFTEAEKEAAISKYIVKYSMYLLEITRDSTNYVFGYDTRNAEWFLWTGLQINTLIENEGVVYFAGDDGFLKSFDTDLYDDWTDYERTTGASVDFDRISGMIWFEDSGYPSTLDYYVLRLKEYAVAASLDISIVYLQGIEEVEQAIQNAYLVWDVASWDEAAWANLEYTDLVSAPHRLSHRLQLPKKGYFFQVRWRNNRSEPVEVYAESFIARTSGEI